MIFLECCFICFILIEWNEILGVFWIENTSENNSEWRNTAEPSAVTNETFEQKLSNTSCQRCQILNFSSMNQL